MGKVANSIHNKTKVVSVAADKSSFECVVTTQVVGSEWLVQKRVVVKSLTALIEKFSSAR